MRNLIILLSFCVLVAVGAAADSTSRVVPQKFDEVKSMGLAIDFLNKYAEYLRAPKSEANSNIIRRTKEDGFKYIKGNDAAFEKLSPDLDFNISFQNGVYNASWEDGGKTLVKVSFPANITLLTFCDKKELEKKMAHDLSNLPSNFRHPSIPEVPVSKLRPISHSDMLVLDKGYFISPRLQNLTVYTKDNSNSMCRLFVAKSGPYIMEAIQNMMLTGYSSNPVYLNLDLVEYGYKASKHSKPLDAVFNMFAAEGSVPYWGWETSETNNIKGLYVWKNEEGGFVHFLTLSIPSNIMEKGGEIKGRLRCYVRLDNVKSLFEEYM